MHWYHYRYKDTGLIEVVASQNPPKRRMGVKKGFFEP